MRQADRRGLALSTDSESAATLYRDGIDLLASSWSGTGETLDAAIAADPDFALAHAARARLHAVRAEPAQARARIATALEAVARHGTERERSHVDVLALTIEGRSEQALERALAHAETWPRDILILSLPLGAYGLYAFSGMAGHDQARVDLCERHARHYGADDWWFLVLRGWAHAENREVAHGRAMIERSFALRRRNAYTAHALAHAMFEDGSNAEADALIGGWLPEYGRAGPLYGHIAWHQALLALENDDAARALAIYADEVKTSVSAAPPINVVADMGSLLWRLLAYGNAVPEGSWAEAASYAADAFPHPGFAFVDAHMAILEAATGERAAIERRAEALETLIAQGRMAAGWIVPALCRALLAFAEEDYAGCARVLEPVAHDIVRLGGSHAQREVFEDTLLIALMRSGEVGKARTLLDERLHRRPSPRDARWRASVS